MAGLDGGADTQYNDAELRRISNALRLTRDRFSEIYDPLATAKGNDTFKLVGLDDDLKENQFYAPLVQARNNGWVHVLIERLVHAGGVPDDIPAPLRVGLEAIISPRMGFQDVVQLDSGVVTARRRVCRIRVQADQEIIYGTGFLVGPQTVLTSWHVVRKLLDDRNRQIDGSHRHVQVTFGKVSGLPDGEIVGVLERWLIDCSPAHPSESPPNSMLDFSTSVPEGFDKTLDYALIRLANPVGRQRGYYTLDARRRPCVKPPRTQVTLFQHPAGEVMLVAHGAGSGLWPPGIETRMQHSANSMSGSSGGLILDADWHPIALHQCGYKRDDGQSSINGAIPTACIAAAANESEFNTVVGIDPIWRLPVTGDPIVGRDEFQRIAQDVAYGKKRIVSIYGDENTGKTYCLEILEALLGKAEHIFVELEPADRPAAPEEFAAKLAAKAIETPGVKNEQTKLEFDSGKATWIRDNLYPTLIERLKIAAGTRTLWIILDNLDTNGLDGTASWDLLNKMYREVGSTPFLRFVLMGLRGAVPSAPQNMVAYYETTTLRLEDIEIYAQRRDTESGGTRSASALADAAKMTMRASHYMTLPKVPAVASAIKTILESIFQEET